LLGLNRLWGLNWSRTQLLALGATLGADVPFFIGGKPAFVEGIGERLTPIELPPQRWAVLKPNASIATPKIFSSELLTRDTKAATVEGLLDDTRKRLAEFNSSSFSCSDHRATSATLASTHTAEKLELAGQNDLQAVAESLCPEVSQACRWLERQFGNSRMTGSGSAVFAHVGEVSSTVGPSVATKSSTPWPTAEMQHDWTGRMCNSLSSHPLVDWIY
jgi:4-diphosphocytidyl-2-C-methyl-D-erythritol kinase